MAYKIKLSVSGSQKQIMSAKQVYISKEQAKKIKQLASEKGISGVFVYLDKEK